MSEHRRERQAGRRVGRAGFTLLEVMIAVLVLGTALVALTRMLALGRLSMDTDTKRVVALSLLRREAALMQERGYATLATEAEALVEDASGYSRSITVTSAGVGLKLVTVRVSWQSPTGHAASESLQLIVADTVLPMESWDVP